MRHYVIAEFVTKSIDFCSQRLVFLNFALEKPFGDGGFLSDASRSENIGIPTLVGRGGKVPKFDQTFFNESAKQVMRTTVADPDSIGQIPLGQFRVVM